jgi:hypothetical protein
MPGKLVGFHASLNSARAIFINMIAVGTPVTGRPCSD